jgi:hypothetical protein
MMCQTDPVPSFRLELLKIPPHLMTDEQLVEAAKNVLAARTMIGHDRVERLLRELRDRFGMTQLEVSKLTGFPLGYVFQRTKRRS